MSFQASSEGVGRWCCSKGKLFQIRGAVELKARLVNTVLSAGWDSSWRSDDRS